MTWDAKRAHVHITSSSPVMIVERLTTDHTLGVYQANVLGGIRPTQAIRIYKENIARNRLAISLETLPRDPLMGSIRSVSHGSS